MSNIWTLLGLVKAQNLIQNGALFHFSLIDTHPPNIPENFEHDIRCQCKTCKVSSQTVIRRHTVTHPPNIPANFEHDIRCLCKTCKVASQTVIRRHAVTHPPNIPANFEHDIRCQCKTCKVYSQTVIRRPNVSPCSCKKCIENEYTQVKFIGIGKTSFQIIQDNDPELERENIMLNRTMITTIPTIFIPQRCYTVKCEKNGWCLCARDSTEL